MKTFASITEAFDWWIKTIYPNLSPEVKKGKLTSAWRDYTHSKSISETRMKDVLVEFGDFEIKTLIVYKPIR